MEKKKLCLGDSGSFFLEWRISPGNVNLIHYPQILDTLQFPQVVNCQYWGTESERWNSNGIVIRIVIRWSLSLKAKLLRPRYRNGFIPTSSWVSSIFLCNLCSYNLNRYPYIKWIWILWSEALTSKDTKYFISESYSVMMQLLEWMH